MNIPVNASACSPPPPWRWPAACPLPPWPAEPGKLLIWINGDKGLQRPAEDRRRVRQEDRHPGDRRGTRKTRRASSSRPPPPRRAGHLDLAARPHRRMDRRRPAAAADPSKKVRDDIDPLAWKAFSVGGKTWGYPISIEAVSLVYNKALVKTPPSPSRR